jgi:hypothetical protein
MSCPVHDRCTCYGSSLQYSASMTTTSTGSAQFAPQTNNIYVGYEWAAPLVATSAAWYPLESVMVQPPTSHPGQDILQSDYYRLGNGYETSPPLFNACHRESRGLECEQKQAPPLREQVCFPNFDPPSRAYAKFSLQHNIHILRRTSRVFLG